LFKTGFLLSTDSHLHAAAFNCTTITVWQDGKIIDFGGRIDMVYPDAVTINGIKYLKTVSEFKIA
jgi:hypothetical protein